MSNSKKWLIVGLTAVFLFVCLLVGGLLQVSMTTLLQEVSDAPLLLSLPLQGMVWVTAVLTAAVVTFVVAVTLYLIQSIRISRSKI